jgi:hypothetical protein
MTLGFLTRRIPRERMATASSSPTAGNITGVGFAAATAVASRQPILTRAETAPCTCPEHCERDHDDG